MYCLRWWIPLFLLPFPHASPFFLVLFLVSFALHSQPCIYCALILTGLFTTSANWYGPSSTIAAPTNITVAATQTPASYGWLDLAPADGFFSPLTRPGPAATAALADKAAPGKEEEADVYRLAIPWSEIQWRLPKSFHFGLGNRKGNGVSSTLPRTRPAASSSGANNGRRERDEVEVYRITIPWSKIAWDVPKRFHLGLGKHHGLGFWIDLGSDTPLPSSIASSANA